MMMIAATLSDEQNENAEESESKLESNCNRKESEDALNVMDPTTFEKRFLLYIC